MNQDGESLQVSRFIRANAQHVFDAWTDPLLIVRWWGAGDVNCPAAEVDLSIGGRYRIANRTPDGTTMWITGTFTHIDPPTALIYTWAMEPVDDDDLYSLVEVEFEAADGGTNVKINHSRIGSPQARETNLHGWNGCLEGLDHLLSH